MDDVALPGNAQAERARMIRDGEYQLISLDCGCTIMQWQPASWSPENQMDAITLGAGLGCPAADDLLNAPKEPMRKS